MSDDLSWCSRPAKPEENGNLELCPINKSQELHTWYDAPSVAVWKSALKQHMAGVIKHQMTAEVWGAALDSQITQENLPLLWRQTHRLHVMMSKDDCNWACWLGYPPVFSPGTRDVAHIYIHTRIWMKKVGERKNKLQGGAFRSTKLCRNGRLIFSSEERQVWIICCTQMCVCAASGTQWGLHLLRVVRLNSAQHENQPVPPLYAAYSGEWLCCTQLSIGNERACIVLSRNSLNANP